MTYGFRDLAVAQSLKRLVAPKQQAVGQGLEDILSRALIFLTPAGGIPARSGTLCGVASCQVFMINETNNLVAYTNPDGSTLSLPVYNLATSSVGGSKYIMTKDCLGKPVVDWEDC